MPVVSPQISAMKDWRTKFINMVADLLPEGILPPPPGNMPVTEPGTWKGAAQSALGFLVPQPEDTLIAPAELRPNFRSPQQIQALRRMMAEEQRARGPLGTKLGQQGTQWPYTGEPPLAGQNQIPYMSYIGEQPDPIDQILRGSWYHGMSEKARFRVGDKIDFDTYIKNYSHLPPDEQLAIIHDMGFPLSAHDTQSISNKLGEPAGVSLSLNPTVSGKFSADPNIFRVMPLYGGPPTERTVNLMTPQGRNALNDAYDVVANNIFESKIPYYSNYDMQALRDLSEPQIRLLTELQPTGIFNQRLSNQLQNQGYRHILYNPQRWNEYEMLALDPKYALPLDYRRVNEYIPGYGLQNNYKGYRNVYDKDYGVTPGARLKGLNQIENIMSQNASRLGDIYSERSWWDRLSEPVKQMLLQDNPQAEQIIQKLKGGT